jgi:hypothetical protein
MAKENALNFVIPDLGKVIFNPTNEDFDMQYAGVSFTLQAGQKMKIMDHAANHLLNAFGPRGLCDLSYGADEEKVAAQGRERNREFKIAQVTNFNVRNEARKHMQLGYLPPSELMKRYAKEMGIDLMQPYATKNVEKLESDERVAALERQNENLQEQISKMMEMMKAQMNLKKEWACDYPGCGASFDKQIALEGHKRSHLKEEKENGGT